MKFKNISLSILALSLTVFVGCKDGDQETEINSTTTQQETTTNPNTTLALNPEHGQPGHTCALPVGAPLDQAAGNTMQQQQQQSTPTSSSNVSPVRMNSSTATPTKNPPHGEPGHVCAVPVGADLN